MDPVDCAWWEQCWVGERARVRVCPLLFGGAVAAAAAAAGRGVGIGGVREGVFAFGRHRGDVVLWENVENVENGGAAGAGGPVELGFF